jgi:hypothetical protein
MKNVMQPMPWKAETTPAYPLAPLLAGARARGVADAFEFLGLATVLLDERGEVLHLSAGAVEAMKDELFRDSGRLRARDRLGDVRLRIAISSALRDGESVELVLPTSEGHNELALRIAPIGNDLGDEACQLLRAVIVIDRVAATMETCN